MDVIGGWGPERGPKRVTDTVNKCRGPRFSSGIYEKKNKETFEETIPCFNVSAS